MKYPIFTSSLRNVVRTIILITALLCMFAHPISLLKAAAAPAKVYVCPDCGCASDQKDFDKPGNCPSCGMPLIEKTAQQNVQKHVPTVAVLLFDGAEIIDYAGPWEVFGEAGFKVFTVAENAKPIAATFGQNIVPDHTFANCPKADILLVPGGGVRNAVANPALIKWVQSQAQKSEHVMSVCTGAFILAKAGVLNGLRATTIAHALDDLAQAAPNTKVVSDQRYVDNGKVITAAGLSAGIDTAFHLIAKIKGAGSAQAIALGMEYQWDPEGKFARATLADTYLPQINISEGEILSTKGDSTHWELQAVVWKPSSQDEIVQLIARQAADASKRARSKVTVETSQEAKGTVRWNFSDEQGRTWQGSGAVEKASEPNKFLVTLKVLTS